MSPSSRERAYAKRRYDKWQQRQAVKEAHRRSARHNLGIALALGVVVLGIVIAITQFQGNSSTTTAASSASAAASGASASGAAAASAASSAASDAASAAADNPCGKPPATTTSPKQFSTVPAASTAEGKEWKWAIETSCGPIAITLDGKAAPQAVASTIYLSQQGFYDNTPCHRLTTAGLYVLQCGDPTGTGTGSPGYRYGPVENAPKDNVYPAGTVAMARAARDGKSMGSQFFLVYKDSPIPSDTAGGYTVIGKIVGGLATVEKVAAGGVTGGGADGPPARAVSITGTTIS